MLTHEEALKLLTTTQRRLDKALHERAVVQTELFDIMFPNRTADETKALMIHYKTAVQDVAKQRDNLNLQLKEAQAEINLLQAKLATVSKFKGEI